MTVRRSRHHSLEQRMGEAIMAELPADGRFVMLYSAGDDGVLRVVSNDAVRRLPRLLRRLADTIEDDNPEPEIYMQGEA